MQVIFDPLTEIWDSNKKKHNFSKCLKDKLKFKMVCYQRLEFFVEYLEYEMIATHNYRDIARKQLHRVIFDPLVHLRINYHDCTQHDQFMTHNK